MFDVIVIGGGPAGITAGIYIKRAGFNVLLFNNGKSAIKKTDKIENYYGFENPIDGNTLYENGIKQAKNLGIEIVEKEVIGLKYSETDYNKYEVVIANQGKDEKYEVPVVVLATGANRFTPNIQGIKEFEGKGVSYCAVCDGAFYRDKDIAVLGSGEYAVGEIQELLPIANNVTMLTNGDKPIENRNGINIDERKIKQVRGNEKVELVEFEDGTTQSIDGLFIAQGTASSIDFARKIGAKIENNVIVVNENMETTVKGIFACGDCTGGILQISKAVCDGTKAGLAIIKQLRNS